MNQYRNSQLQKEILESVKELYREGHGSIHGRVKRSDLYQLIWTKRGHINKKRIDSFNSSVSRSIKKLEERNILSRCWTITWYPRRRTPSIKLCINGSDHPPQNNTKVKFHNVNLTLNKEGGET